MASVASAVWEEVTRRLRKEISEEDFETWFDSVNLIAVGDASATIHVPSGYRRDVIRDTYGGAIRNVFSGIFGKEVSVEFRVAGQTALGLEPAPNDSYSEGRLDEEIGVPLNFKYTFDTFIVGESNRLTHAAALSVANAPAKTYNPLFIYGGVGLGKTHVMQAIGHHIISKYPGTRVLYCPAESFVNEFIESIQQNKRCRFQRKFRNVDVLLIDDIHFLVGKESTQEEFFHTFNALHNRHKQIVVSSDRSPKDIPTIEDRLRSRFTWGLITDIQYPDLETRAAILGKKCEQEMIDLPEEVILFIAQRIKYSIRELEGALIKIAAQARYTNTKPTLELASKVLGKLSLLGEGEVSVERIQKKIAEHFRIKTSDILGRDRSRSVTFPRQIAMYLCRELTRHSYPEIAAFFGRRDHTTVIHSYKKIDKEIERDEDFHRFVDRLRMTIVQPE